MTLTKKATKLSPIKIFNEARGVYNAIYDKREEEKKYTLRAGSAGCVVNGRFIGSNPYPVLARFMGFQTKKSPTSYNVFDNGNATEMLWDKYLQHSEYVVLEDEDYPLVTNHFKYPLTGRPDGVFGKEDEDGNFQPIFGVEHKAVSSTSSLKVIKEVRPKTQHLIQAATYSKFLDLPWVLCYTQSSNFYADKATKMEFLMEWMEGVLGFWEPNGTYQETVITSQGIDDFYEAICEAYDTKDHSFFRRDNTGWDGMYENYWDEYDNFLLAVDSSWEWSKWVEHAEAASQSNLIIENGGRKKCFYLTDVVTGDIVVTCDTLEEAREELYNGILS